MDALHDATIAGNSAEIRRLVDRGDEVDRRDGAGNTPLQYAAMRPDGEVVRYLIDHGATVMTTNRLGTTPLHYASAPAARVLVERGADVNATDSHGWTPLHVNRSPEVIDLLLDKGATLQRTDLQGWTPLHSAASRLRPEAAVALVRRGADLYAKTKPGRDGKTPLDLTKRHPEIGEAMLAAAKEREDRLAEQAASATGLTYVARQKNLPEDLEQHVLGPMLGLKPKKAGRKTRARKTKRRLTRRRK